VAGVFARRERHRQRPLALRIGAALAGFLLLALSTVLALVLPEVGLPVVFAALALLALEFDWAARLLARVVLLAERVRGRYASAPALARVAAIAIPILVVAVVALALMVGILPMPRLAP
jgi:hypothetical protein